MFQNLGFQNALLVVPNAPDSQHLAALQDLQGKLEQLVSQISGNVLIILAYTYVLYYY